MINHDHDHNHQDNDFYDDDDNDNEMMIRALRVTWVNCGKVGGLYCSMVQYCNVMKIKHSFEKKKKNSSFSSNLCGITGVVWNP